MTELRCLYDGSTDTRDWTHYSEELRPQPLNIDVIERHNDKSPESVHLGVGSTWVNADLMSRTSRDYKHKVRLVNLGELKLLEISRRTIFDLLPLPLGSWGIDWRAVADRGYDGVYIAHDDLYYGEPLPPGYGRWKTFVHRFDIDTIVVWRNARFVEIENDYPPLTADERVKYDEYTAYWAQREVDLPIERAARAVEMAALSKDERRKRRNSLEKRIDEDAEYVAEFRQQFPGYDEHYPVRPPTLALKNE